jgi:hypothetical protein
VFNLQISTLNAAFEDDPCYALSYLVRDVADDLLIGKRKGKVSDPNGNTVGTWSLTDDN